MGKLAHRAEQFALRGAELLDHAADRLAEGGWIETGLVVLLVGRALVHGHQLAKKAQSAIRDEPSEREQAPRIDASGVAEANAEVARGPSDEA